MARTIKPSVVFLTRKGCANTPLMRKNLDAVTRDYEVVDIGTLLPTDYRRAYGTPTVLVNGADLMGMSRRTSATDPG